MYLSLVSHKSLLRKLFSNLTPSHIQEGPMNLGLSTLPSFHSSFHTLVCPSIHLLRGSLWIGLLVFSETQHGVWYPCEILYDWARFIRKNSLLAKMTKNDQKWPKMVFGGFFVALCHKIWKTLQNKSINGALTFCKNCISGSILIHTLHCKNFWSSQVAGFFDHQFHWKESMS